MPCYEYSCSEHGRFEEFFSMADYKNEIPCPKCQKISQRIISLPADVRKFEGFYHPDLEINITSQKQYNREMRKRGLGPAREVIPKKNLEKRFAKKPTKNPEGLRKMDKVLKNWG